MPNQLHGPGKAHALELIRAGKVNETADWSFSPGDEDRLLGDPPDWDRYASWHMGRDPAVEDRETKAAWKYPFGKNGEVYRSALRAIRTRAAQQDETEISEAARDCLDAMEEDDGQADARAAETRGTRIWYRIAAQAGTEPTEAEILIYDAIGWWFDGVSAKAFVADLQQLPASVKTIRVRVNSPGGDAFEATAIANALRRHPARVEMWIEGFAASAATIVTSGGGDVIRIDDNALVMVHSPWAMAIGPARSMREAAAKLDRAAAAIVTTYQRHSALSREQLAALMDGETWMDADEAVANGFATEKVSGLKPAALIQPRSVAALSIPAKYREQVARFVARPAAAEPAAIIQACKAAGLAELADELLGQPMDTVTARLEQERTARAARAAREREIRALCATAKLPELADGYVRGGMPVADVRAHLTVLAAKLDAIEIDGHLRPDPERLATVKAALNPTAVYAERNRLGRKE